MTDEELTHALESGLDLETFVKSNADANDSAVESDQKSEQAGKLKGKGGKQCKEAGKPRKPAKLGDVGLEPTVDPEMCGLRGKPYLLRDGGDLS